MSDDHCAVCAEPLVWAAAGQCGHTEVCHKCTSRLRLVLKDTRCVLCKQARVARERAGAAASSARSRRGAAHTCVLD
jgi:hypothetical protein